MAPGGLIRLNFHAAVLGAGTYVLGGVKVSISGWRENRHEKDDAHKQMLAETIECVLPSPPVVQVL